MLVPSIGPTVTVDAFVSTLDPIITCQAPCERTLVWRLDRATTHQSCLHFALWLDRAVTHKSRSQSAHLDICNPPTQSLSLPLVLRATVLGSLGGRLQQRVLLEFHLVEESVKQNVWREPLKFLLSARLDPQTLPHRLVRGTEEALLARRMLGFKVQTEGGRPRDSPLPEPFSLLRWPLPDPFSLSWRFSNKKANSSSSNVRSSRVPDMSIHAFAEILDPQQYRQSMLAVSGRATTVDSKFRWT